MAYLLIEHRLLALVATLLDEVSLHQQLLCDSVFGRVQAQLNCSYFFKSLFVFNNILSADQHGEPSSLASGPRRSMVHELRGVSVVNIRRTRTRIPEGEALSLPSSAPCHSPFPFSSS